MPTNRRAAKKLHRENHAVKSAPRTPEPAVVPDVTPPVEPPVPVIEQPHPLMAEVESFLSKRDELAQKLALEIEATEKKLAELKKTAASLFPETAGGAPADRKSKKNKAKSANREAKAEAAPTPAEVVVAAELPK